MRPQLHLPATSAAGAKPGSSSNGGPSTPHFTPLTLLLFSFLFHNLERAGRRIDIIRSALFEGLDFGLT